MTAVRARKAARIKAATAAGGPRYCGCGVLVDGEERRHLIDACAFSGPNTSAWPSREASASRTCGRRPRMSTRY